MKFTYRNTWFDLLLINFDFTFRSIGSWILSLAVAAFILWVLDLSIIDSVALRVILTLFGIAVITPILQFLNVIFGFLLCLMPWDRGFLTEHTLELTTECLIERTTVNETRTNWSGVTRVRNLFGRVIIYTAPRLAHIVPPSAFGEPGQFRELTDYCQNAMRRNDKKT